MAKISQNKSRPMKKSSKISNALKKFFIDAIICEGMNIKNAAKRFKINYSSAKVIYKQYKTEQLARIKRQKKLSSGNRGEDLQEENSDSNQEKLRCSYKNIQEIERTCDSAKTKESRLTKMSIISTVGWDFMSKGPQHIS